ncbi:uncharacterized protein EAE98_009249 [Botrytis deweyae]|uniref:PNPLA domain-containing protein n=1 Tax=Botrytis deweyae TaxID=2478750 RepID=A0ABQ7IBP3_9HELO|nr:uncharacterized protein EAE98_009249 [Botrytis deweyae]KAF7919409.1 hypothetical protein EAE98_009249 [Botrytis deweyae]
MSTSQQPPENQALRLLALDGGGVKGLTSLLILRRLMLQLKRDATDPDEPVPRPCDVFDLIGGTSTGGLIAIMLGRLGMTVDECIETYKKFGKTVFGKKKAFGIARTMFSGSMYETEDLQTAIKTLVAERLKQEEAPSRADTDNTRAANTIAAPRGDQAVQASSSSSGEGAQDPEDAPLNDIRVKGVTGNCRMFVCATRNKTFNYELIRNYTSGKPDQVDYDCTIWEAGSATAAAPMFFGPVTFQKSKAKFSDGGTTINCPLPEVVNEARRLWNSPQFACIVSLGTGWPANTKVKSGLLGFLGQTVKVLTDAQKKYEEWVRGNRDDLNIKESYFRFNVEQGMDQLKLDEWAETEEMTALTDSYLGQDKHMNEVERCVKLLRITDSVNESAQIAVRESRQRRILDQLRFREIHARHEEIRLAHRETFEWLFHETQPGETFWTNFMEWLQNDNSIYWINGKAGSGKSTLMKFINDDPRLMKALRMSPWADGRPVIKASFYFWYNGTSMQKSRKELMQSLLLQILELQPHLISIIFHEVFALSDNDFDFEKFSTEAELMRALRETLDQPERTSNFIFLIDGLDEYYASEQEMVTLTDLFQSLAALPRVKFVLSSRPLPAYSQAFQAGASLELQHAKGVFRWVDLVMEAILEGIRHCNTLYELQEEVKRLPPDLIPFYGHMWNGIKPEYRIEASQLFQLVQKAMMYNNKEQHNRGYEQSHRAVTLFLATTEDPDQQVFARPILPLTTTRKADLAKLMEGRLRSRCMGLLDFHRAESETNVPDELKLADATVQLANRSVSEFLEIRTDILACTERTGFDARVSLMRSFVRQIEAWEPETPNDSDYHTSHGRRSIWNLVGNTMRLAYQAGTSLSELEVTLLDHMDSVVQARCQTYINDHWDVVSKHSGLNKKCRAKHWSDFVPEDYQRPVPWHDSFLSLAVRHGAIGYVQQSLMKADFLRVPKPTGGFLDRFMYSLAPFRANINQLSKPGRPLLDYAVIPEPAYPLCTNAINPDLVELLLDYGANPNEAFNGSTPWQNALDTVKNGQAGCFQDWAKILELLIVRGADPNAYCKSWKKTGKGTGVTMRYSALNIVHTGFFREYDHLKEVQDLRQRLSDLLCQRGARDFKLNLT